MKIHLNKVTDFAGFSTENVKNQDTVKVLVRAALTSEDEEFYGYTEKISSIFLGKNRITDDAIYQFLVVIHQDLSADLYLNDFPVLTEVKAKRDLKKGEIVMQSHIADIRKVKFPGIEITETDKIIYCFKVGWRFGLFFDLTAHRNLATPGTPEKLDLEQMMTSIGQLKRYLNFYHVYKALASDEQFQEMIKDGWFPFIEISGWEYKKLTEIYQNKFDFESRVGTLMDNFSQERIKRITEKWWRNQIFSKKRPLIEAGISAYLQNDQPGFINSIKTLGTEIEGILREIYLAETRKGNDVKSPELISHIVEKAKKSSGSEHSLLLPTPFLKYLQDVIFANFNVEAGEVDMSRNTLSHGVAHPERYTKDRALQYILILDQIYFYN